MSFEDHSKTVSANNNAVSWVGPTYSIIEKSPLGLTRVVPYTLMEIYILQIIQMYSLVIIMLVIEVELYIVITEIIYQLEIIPQYNLMPWWGYVW